MLVAGGETDGTVTGLASAVGLPVPTAHHLLRTLVVEGLLGKDERARYQLGPSAHMLADRVQRSIVPPTYLLRSLNQLAAATGETVYLAAWRHQDIQVLSWIEGYNAVRVSVPSVPYVDAHARATGKLLLALGDPITTTAYLERHPLRPVTDRTIATSAAFDQELESIRRDGYALDVEEFQPGVCCVAVPIFRQGSLLGAFASSVPKACFTERQALLLTALRAAAGSVAGDLTVDRHTPRRGM